MNPTQTGTAVGVSGAATLLVVWALMGFPVHAIPDIPPQLEAIAAAMITIFAWGGHCLSGMKFPSVTKGSKNEEVVDVGVVGQPPGA